MNFFNKAKKKLVKTTKIVVKSKTMLFNIGLALVGAIQLYSGKIESLFGSQGSFGVFMILIAGIGAYLRTVTTTSLQEKVTEDV